MHNLSYRIRPALLLPALAFIACGPGGKRGEQAPPAAGTAEPAAQEPTGGGPEDEEETRFAGDPAAPSASGSPTATSNAATAPSVSAVADAATAQSGKVPQTLAQSNVAGATDAPATPPGPPSEEAAGSAAGDGATCDPEQARALVEQGRELVARGDDTDAKKAVGIYVKALQLDSTCATALWELGWAYQVLERWDDALGAWTQLQTMAPNFPELGKYMPVLEMRRDQATALAALPDANALPPREQTARAGPTVTIAAVGDVQMGRAWPESNRDLPPDDGAVLFARVRNILRDADVTFGNLETAMADSGTSTKCKPGSKVCYAFRVPTRFTTALVDAGFDVMSLANNHSGDFGEKGRKETLEALDRAGIRHSGPVGDIASWQENGLRMALVAFAPGGGLYRVQDIDMAQRVVADLSRRHDLVIVSFHGGAEGAKADHVPKKKEVFYGENRGDVYAFAHAVVDAGADLVLGHGPHVVRAAEIYRGRLIAYSLGNFCSWRGFNLRGKLGRSVILKATLAPNGVVVGAQLTALRLMNEGIPTPDDTGRAIQYIRELSRQDLGTSPFDSNGVYEPGRQSTSPTTF